jgi:hypothetical protein
LTPVKSTSGLDALRGSDTRDRMYPWHSWRVIHNCMLTSVLIV